MTRSAAVLRVLCCTLVAPLAGGLSPVDPLHSGHHAELVSLELVTRRSHSAAMVQDPLQPAAHRSHSMAEVRAGGATPGFGAAAGVDGPAGGGGPRGTAAGLLDVHADVAQAPTTTEHQSFLSRLQDSIGDFVIGIVLIVFSFPVLWFNESRNAKMESLVEFGESQCRTVSGGAAEKANRNWLVHLKGEPMRSAAKVADTEFDVAFDTDCVRLWRAVEVYQWIQHERREEKERLGGGKDVITTYSYTAEWCAFWNDSNGFHDGSKRNTKPAGLSLGSSTANCSRVECADAFLLPEELVTQCNAFVRAEDRLGQTVTHRSGAKFAREGGYFYHRTGGRENKVGDARVTFQYVPNGPISVLALQVEAPGETRDTFLPYRLVGRPLCGGMSEEEEKLALRKKAETSRADLAAEAQVGSGCLWCLCCACNLVAMCCAGALTQEVYHLFHGDLGQGACFRIVRTRMQMLKWGLRLLGWVMLFAGLYMLFSPLLTFIRVIPFLGPIASSLGSWLIWILCLINTLAVASVVICLAYLAYHPLMALMYSALAAAIVAIPLIILRVTT